MQLLLIYPVLLSFVLVQVIFVNARPYLEDASTSTDLDLGGQIVQQMDTGFTTSTHFANKVVELAYEFLGLIKTLTGSSSLSADGENSMNKIMQLVTNLLNKMNVYRERLHLHLINLAETWGHTVLRVALNGWEMRQDIISAVNNKVQSSVNIVHDVIAHVNEGIESLTSIVVNFIRTLNQIQNHLNDIRKLIVQKAN